MAEWVIEQGIGEDRALLVDGGHALAAKLYWPGELFAGQRLRAAIASRNKQSGRALAIGENGVEILLDRLPPSASEGSEAEIVITRAPMAENGRLKRAQARIAGTDDPSPQSPFDRLPNARQVASLPDGLWEEIWQQAYSRQVVFAGGTLIFSPTPAMTLIDIDGDMPPHQLAQAAVPALARAIRQFDLGGSIGVDFPTITQKSQRREIDLALENALAQFPHERTAINGFGFAQIVARLEGPSILHRITHAPAAAAARFTLRQAERINQPGALQITIHPAVEAKMDEAWRVQIARRTGREIRIKTDPTLAPDAGFAQAVPL